MPGLDILKDWQGLKKQGWPALLVAVIFTGYELLAPKDKTCIDEVAYLTRVIEEDKMNCNKKDSLNYQLERELLEANNIINKKDSTWNEKVVKTAKSIVKHAKK